MYNRALWCCLGARVAEVRKCSLTNINLLVMQAINTLRSALCSIYRKGHLQFTFVMTVIVINVKIGGVYCAVTCLDIVDVCVAELFQADVDEFCQFYSRKDEGLCFPDFQRVRRTDSNYLGDENIEDMNRSVTSPVVLFSHLSKHGPQQLPATSCTFYLLKTVSIGNSSGNGHTFLSGFQFVNA